MDELVTPQNTINYHTKRLGISVAEIGVAPIVVISWGDLVIRSMANKTGAQHNRYWLYAKSYPMYSIPINSKAVSFANVPVGAAGTIMMMEEMVACGGQVFIGLGWAGSLQTNISIGAYLIPTKCISEEGTSRHYYDGLEDLKPDPKLEKTLKVAAEELGINLEMGLHWTTDAPYRETHSKVESYRKQGVIGVDMETSAMYALGNFRGVSVCNLLVVSDVLGEEWGPAFDTHELNQATLQAEQIILRCIENIEI